MTLRMQAVCLTHAEMASLILACPDFSGMKEEEVRAWYSATKKLHEQMEILQKEEIKTHYADKESTPCPE